MARFQIVTVLLALAFANKLEVIQPISRSSTQTPNPDHAPCGNVPKGPSHLLAEPGSLNPVSWSVKEYSDNGRCLVSLATEPEVKHKRVLWPNDDSADAQGWFDCGHNTTYSEGKTFTFPQDMACDACTLQFIFTGSETTEFTCIDLKISSEYVSGCWERCKNGGACVNSQCQCLIGYYGDFCERSDDDEVSPENLLFWFLSFCLLFFCLGVLATFVYVNHYKVSKPTYQFFMQYLPCFMRNPALDYDEWRPESDQSRQPNI